MQPVVAKANKPGRETIVFCFHHEFIRAASIRRAQQSQFNIGLCQNSLCLNALSIHFL